MGVRTTQTAVEVLVQPNTQRARATQVAIEALVQPNTQRARVTQTAIEVLVSPPPPGTISDTTSVSDSIEYSVQAGTIAIADSVSTTDSVARTSSSARAAVDTTAVSDAVSVSGTLTRAVADTVATSDLVNHVSTGAQAYILAAVDTLATSDAIAAASALTRTPSDSTATTDAVATANGTAQAIEDTTTVSDSVLADVELVRVASDTLATADAIAHTVVDVPFHGVTTPTDTLVTSDYILPFVTRHEVVEGELPAGYTTTLAEDIDSTQTTITVTEPAPENTTEPFVVTIGGEQMLVTSTSGTTWTVERAYNDTTATTHTSTAVIRPTLVHITVDGAEITHVVDFRRSRFTTYANGQPGTAEIMVKDVDHAWAFASGSEVVVRFRGVRVWGGYVGSIRRTFAFSEGSGAATEPRYLTLDCVDYNILLAKRLYFDPTDPTDMFIRQWDHGTSDAVVIGELVSQFLDLSDDGLSFDIRHVGTPMLPTVSCNPDAPDFFRIGSAGWSWGEVMTAIVGQTGAIYYIDPDKVFRHVDVSTEQSRFGYTGMSDAPGGLVIGFRDLELTDDGSKLINDQITWGAGQGSAEMVVSRETDAASIAVHGLWQNGELRYDMYCQDSVDLRADTWVHGSPQNHRGGKDPRIVLRATVFEPYFRVSDVLTLDVTSFGFSEVVPVRGAEITFPTPWDIQCILSLSHELDMPWSAYEFWFPRLDMDFPGFDPIGLGDPPPPPELEPWTPHDPCIGIGDGSMGWSLPVDITTAFRFNDPDDGTDDLVFRKIVQTNAGGTSTENTFAELYLYIDRLGGGGLYADLAVKFATGFGTTAYWVNFVPVSVIASPINNNLYMARFRIEEGAVHAKVWDAASSEPGAWSVSQTGDPGELLVAGGWNWLTYIMSVDPTVGWVAIEGIDITEGYTGAPLVDEFNRVETGGWGTSTINGENWTGNPLTQMSVDGSAARFETGAGGGNGAMHLTMPTIDAPLTSALRGAAECAVSDFETDVEPLYLQPRPDNGTQIYPYFVNDFDVGPSRVPFWGNYASMNGWNFDINTGSVRVANGAFTAELNSGSSQFGLHYSPTDATGSIYEVEVAFSFSRIPLIPYLGDGVTHANSSNYCDFEVSTAHNSQGGPLYSMVRLSSTYYEGNYHPSWYGPDGVERPFSPSVGEIYYLKQQWDGATQTARAKLWSGPTEPDWMAVSSESTSPLLTDLEVEVYANNFAGKGDSGAEYDYLIAWDVHHIRDNVECVDGDPCSGVEPGELEEEPSGGHKTGDFAERSDVTPEGSTRFYTDHQFLRGSTEVWVDGRRIRLSHDYIEYPRLRLIEILSHIDVGGTDSFNPSKPVLINYTIYTIESPAPTQEPI